MYSLYKIFNPGLFQGSLTSKNYIEYEKNGQILYSGKSVRAGFEETAAIYSYRQGASGS
ncbi:MAG TPA: hypothetical protein PLR52_02440 [Bacteroidales bacterium]|nr:hypothetical protein [Bacteroidales bacterium]HPI68296.1 hypothetical protein [Bacteroidales bacterium]HPR72872.1 hypothetical protein [Bacteroidales bacterium]